MSLGCTRVYVSPLLHTITQIGGRSGIVLNYQQNVSKCFEEHMPELTMNRTNIQVEKEGLATMFGVRQFHKYLRVATSSSAIFSPENSLPVMKLQ